MPNKSGKSVQSVNCHFAFIVLTLFQVRYFFLILFYKDYRGGEARTTATTAVMAVATTTATAATMTVMAATRVATTMTTKTTTMTTMASTDRIQRNHRK